MFNVELKPGYGSPTIYHSTFIIQHSALTPLVEQLQRGCEALHPSFVEHVLKLSM
jgi:hypothetical protein